MDSIETIRAVLGWCLVLNMAFLFLAGLGLAFAGSLAKQVHGPMYGLSESDLDRAYFQYLAQYKIGIFLFNLAPYIALRIVA